MPSRLQLRCTDLAEILQTASTKARTPRFTTSLSSTLQNQESVLPLTEAFSRWGVIRFKSLLNYD